MLLFMPSGFAVAQKPHAKVALVIGNSDYKTLPDLRNATNDATAIARVLSSLGFTVFLTQNTTHADLKRTLSFVADQASQADQVIIYFAGHGRNNNGVASLLTIDTNQSDNNVITTRDLLDHFGNPFTQKAVILDACLEIASNEPNAKSDSILLPVNLPLETVLVFATSYGQAAYDGAGAHGVFTGAFLDRLIAHQTDLIHTIQSVRSDVMQASRSHQMPITLSTLTRTFDLNTQTLTNEYGTPTHTLLQSYSSTGFSNKSLLENLAKGPIK